LDETNVHDNPFNKILSRKERSNKITPAENSELEPTVILPDEGHELNEKVDGVAEDFDSGKQQSQSKGTFSVLA